MENSCHDIMMVLAGGIIGLLSSLIILGIQQWINHKGKTKVYYKILGLPFQNNNRPGWGCTEQGDWIAFWVPMAIELMNTSNSTRVIRDLSLHLYKGSDYVTRMVQIEYAKGKETVEYGAENNAYSFTLGPRSVQKHRCLFSYKIHKGQTQSITFDTIKMRYYDEKDRLHEALLDSGIVNCWGLNLYETDVEWIRLGSKGQ